MNNIFLYAYILILIVGFCCTRITNGKKHFCIFSGTVYFLLAALRSSRVGGDSFNYRNMFESMEGKTLQQIFLKSERDPIFYTFMGIMRKITDQYWVMFAVIALFFVVTVWVYIYRYSDDPVLSVVVLLAFNLYQFSLTGLRQAVAIGFIVLAIMAINENKKVLPYILVGVGGLFHASALVFLVIPLLRHLRLKTKFLRFSGIFLFVCYIFRRTIAAVLVRYLGDRGYELKLSESGSTMMLVIAFLFAVALLFIREYADSDQDYRIQYYIGWFAVFFEILVTSQNIFFRIAFYFLIAFATLIPNIANRAKNVTTRRALKVGLYVVLSAQYLFFTIGSCYTLPYTTFWQI